MGRMMALVSCLVLAVHAYPTYARADGGDLLWQSVLGVVVDVDPRGQMAAAGGRVVIVGTTQAASGASIFVVQARDSRSGTILWTDRTNATASSVVMDDHRVVAAGTTTDSTGATHVILRAFHAKTGTLLWKDRRRDSGTSLALDGHRLVVAGTVDNDTKLLLRAYHVKTGAVEWEHRAPPIGFTSVNVGRSRGITLRGKKGFVTALVAPLLPGGVGSACYVRAFDSRRGTVLWEQVAAPSVQCAPTDVASDGRSVILGATGGIVTDNLLVHAWEADDGAPLWQYRTFAGSSFDNELTAVDVSRGQGIIAAWDNSAPATTPGLKEAFIIRSFDLRTGAIRWEDVLFLDQAGIQLWHALGLDVERGRVFAAGLDIDRGTWFVRAYHVEDGALIWNEEFQPAGGGVDYGRAQGLVADGGRVVVVGPARNAAGVLQLVIRAYDAR